MKVSDLVPAVSTADRPAANPRLRPDHSSEALISLLRLAAQRGSA